jgi:hypothetical protein
MQTRGKPTLALRHGGGAIRSIELTFVADTLAAAQLPYEEEVVAQVHRLLQERLYAVDGSPMVLRDEPEAIAKLEKAAGNLLDAVKQLDAWPALNLSLSDFFAEKNWPHDRSMLVRQLLVLQNARQHLFEIYKPSAEFQGAIRKLYQCLTLADPAVTKASITRFLMAIDAALPGLAFPDSTAPLGDDVEDARNKYVREAIKGHTD